PHPGKIKDKTAIARTEASEAMPSTADGGKNAGRGGGTDGVLHIAHACAARDQSGPAIKHAVPNGARVFVFRAAGAQQIPLEAIAKRRIELFTRLGHRVFSVRRRRYRRVMATRKTEKAGTDQSRSLIKKLVTEIPISSRMPTMVKSGCARSRRGKLARRSPLIALRKRRCVLRITSHTNRIPATAIP